jgi:hypothetical protein
VAWPDCGTEAADGKQSPVITVTVSANPTTLPIETGGGIFTGKICFDINYSNSGGACGETASRTKYSFVSTPTQPYTFTPEGSPSGIRFDYLNQNSSNPVIQSISQSGNTVIVTFNTNLDVSARGVTRANAYKAELYVIYTSGATEYKKVLTLSVADCQCCPGVIIRSSQGGEHTGPASKSIADDTPYATLLSTYGFSTTGKDLCVYYKDAVPSSQSWADAVSNCASGINVDEADRSLGGWRLPNIAELGQMSTAATGGAPKWNALPSTADADSRTTNLIDYSYWSITEYGTGSGETWRYNYTGTWFSSKSYTRLVRCVRTMN